MISNEELEKIAQDILDKYNYIDDVSPFIKREILKALCTIRDKAYKEGIVGSADHITKGMIQQLEVSNTKLRNMQEQNPPF